MSPFVQGLRDCLPVVVAVTFFAVVFGATAVNAGFSVAEAVAASVLMFAGASQFVFIDLYGQKAPAWSILLAVFAINFRHILYSASIGRLMGAFSRVQKSLAFFVLADPVFASGEAQAERGGLTPAYYFAYGGLLYLVWVVFTALGAMFGRLIRDPQAFALDMLLPIYFLTLLFSFKNRPHWLAIVLVSGAVSVLVERTIGSPWHISLGALAGIAYAIIMTKPVDPGERADGAAPVTGGGASRA